MPLYAEADSDAKLCQSLKNPTPKEDKINLNTSALKLDFITDMIFQKLNDSDFKKQMRRFSCSTDFLMNFGYISCK